MKKIITFCLYIGLALFGVHFVQADNTVPINMSHSQTHTVAVTPDMTEIIIPISIDLADHLAIELIIPIDGAQISVSDPSGNNVITSDDPSINIVSGRSQQPALPGQFVSLPVIESPQSGQWLIHIRFAAINYKTVVIAQTLINTPITYGLAIPVYEYIVGEPVVLASLLTYKGQPLSQADVTFSITTPNANTFNLKGLNNGEGPDAKVDDGLYSNIYTVAMAGEYDILSSAKINYQGLDITRTTSKKIFVTNSVIDINQVQLHAVKSTAGCVTHIEQTIDLTVHHSGDFALSSYLSDGKKRVRGGKRSTLEQGSQQFKIQYNKEKVLAQFAHDATLQTLPISIIQVLKDSTPRVTAMRQLDTQLDLAQVSFCREAIEISGPLITTPVYSNDESYISALSFSFPIYVDNSGIYTGSVNISAANGERIDLVSFQSNFQQGENTFEFSVAGKTFRQADGPYTLNSLLIYTNGHSARLSVLGTTSEFKKEDFYPKANITLIANTLGLERVNWQSTPPIARGQKRVGGYLRSGAAIPYDYEVLSLFDLSQINGTISHAELTITTGDSSLNAPYTQVDVFAVNQPWQAKSVNYDHFCQTFNLCPAWQDKQLSFTSINANEMQTMSSNTLLERVRGWQQKPETNNGLILVSAPHERNYYAVIKEVKLTILYIFEDE